MRMASRCFWSMRPAPGVARRGYASRDETRARPIFRCRTSRSPTANVLGEVGKGLADHPDVSSRPGIAATAAETVGAMEAMNEMTLEYSKTRVQFGQPIGSYQVVQHRLADMFMAQEQGRSMAMLATMSVDNPDEAARRARHRAWPRSASARPGGMCRKARCRCMAASA